MVRDFSGATLDFAATNLVTKVLVSVSHRTYAHAPKASMDGSEKMQSTVAPITMSGVRDLSKVMLFRSLISWKNRNQLAWISVGKSSSHCSLANHSFCIPISARIRKAAAIPKGS